MRDVRCPNVLWTSEARTAAALVDLDSAGPCDRIVTDEIEGLAVNVWRKYNALAEDKSYGKLGDMCMLGAMLLTLPGAATWREEYRNFCRALIRKELSASEALEHKYLNQKKRRA